MADDVITSGRVAPTAAEAKPAAAPKPEPVRHAHRHRVGLMYGLLAVALGGAIAGVVIAAGGASSQESVAWSAWRPSKGSAESMLKEIADHVARQYRLKDRGGQLVGVVASKPAVQDVQIKAIAVRSAPGDNSNISIVGTDKSEMFILCGLGRQCAIAKGKPSTARGRVLRRESLELALYAFKYVPGVDSVIAFLPPAPGSNPQYTIFLRKADLKKQLSEPLAKTLTRPTAPTPLQSDPSETPVIDRLTLPSMYKYSLTQSQEGSAILVLDPLALNG